MARDPEGPPDHQELVDALMAALEPVIAEYMKREPAHLVTPVLLDILTGYGEKIICSVNAGGVVALPVTIASPSRQLQRHRLQSPIPAKTARTGSRAISTNRDSFP